MHTVLRTLIVVATFVAVEASVCGQPRTDAFLEDLSEAQEKSQARDWAAAIPLWERVIAANPHVAWFWNSLGTAQYNAGEYRKAIPSFEKALELGAGPRGRIAFDIAR